MTWNCPSQTAQLNTLSANFRAFTGLLKVVSTGTGAWVWSNVTNSTKNIYAYEQTGGTVDMNSGTASITADLHNSFVMSGGTLTETGTATGCAWVFQGAGIVFNKTGGTISNQISYTVKNAASLEILNQPLTGTGSFTLSYGGSLYIHDPNGITQSANAGAVRVTGTRTYNSGASYFYVGSVPQTTGDGMPATVYDLTVDNPAGVLLSNPANVTNIFSLLSGFYTGTISPDGYYSPNVQCIRIEPSGEQITGLAASVSYPTLFPQRINKSWNLSGTYNGYKSITFYWSDVEDVNTDWVGQGWVPAAYQGIQEHMGFYDVSVSPRWLTVYVEDSISKAIWTIGREDNETLPVVLSSFTATLNPQNNVILRWVTQSETSLSGFFIMRSASSALSEASAVSTMIGATNSPAGASYSFEDRETEPGLWYYWLQSIELNGTNEYYGPISQTIHTPDNNEIPEIPVLTGIQRIFPNPFNPLTTVLYSLGKPSTAQFSIFNARGQLIRKIDTEFRGVGNYSVSWDGKDMSGKTCPTGIYLIRMQAGTAISTAKAVLQK
ncbi:MAG: FlgD immunoglobulin-like domain containing protein [Candidatus Cloacimonadaceae bacterium]|nr:FlgD immunoglobulin-like domain containing protein [Candidatus Cloacimonadaceae bacterium]